MSTINITIIDRSGDSHTVEAPTDMNMNIMELCKASGFDVEGTCGGMAMCASCHCYVQSEHPLSEKSEDEEDMLDEAFFVDDDKSRLGCQLQLKDELDGLVIELAPVG